MPKNQDYLCLADDVENVEPELDYTSRPIDPYYSRKGSNDTIDAYFESIPSLKFLDLEAELLYGKMIDKESLFLRIMADTVMYMSALLDDGALALEDICRHRSKNADKSNSALRDIASVLSNIADRVNESRLDSHYLTEGHIDRFVEVFESVGLTDYASSLIWSMLEEEYGSDFVELERRPDPPDTKFLTLLSAYRAVRADSAMARDMFARTNLLLVASYANRLRGKGLPFLDLVQEGNVGLMKAIEKYDFRRGYRFSTYASWWIKQSMRRAISDKGRTVRLPVHLSDSIRVIDRIIQSFESLNGRRPSHIEISEVLGIPEQKVKKVLEVMESSQVVSSNTPVGDSGSAEIGDFLYSPDNILPDDMINHDELRDSLDKVLETLTPRQEYVIRMRFGIAYPKSSTRKINEKFSPRQDLPLINLPEPADDMNLTLGSISKILNVTKERIRQIESEALRSLRHPSRSRLLEEFLRDRKAQD